MLMYVMLITKRVFFQGDKLNSWNAHECSKLNFGCRGTCEEIVENVTNGIVLPHLPCHVAGGVAGLDTVGVRRNSQSQLVQQWRRDDLHAYV